MQAIIDGIFLNILDFTLSPFPNLKRVELSVVSTVLTYSLLNDPRQHFIHVSPQTFFVQPAPNTIVCNVSPPNPFIVSLYSVMLPSLNLCQFCIGIWTYSCPMIYWATYYAGRDRSIWIVGFFLGKPSDPLGLNTPPLYLEPQRFPWKLENSHPQLPLYWL